jgi:hypothetical protein
MPMAARRACFGTYRRLFRASNPGWDLVMVEDKGPDLVATPLTGNVVRRFATPEDSRSLGRRVDIAAAPSGSTDHNGVNRASEEGSPVSEGHREIVISD